MIRSCCCVLVLLLAGCLPNDTGPTEIRVDFAGKLTDADTGAPVSGIRIALVQIDSLTAAGLQPVIATDTSVQTGDFVMRIGLERPGSSCDNRGRPLTITLRFTDPHGRYAPRDSNQSLCRYTLAELLAATELSIDLARR